MSNGQKYKEYFMSPRQNLCLRTECQGMKSLDCTLMSIEANGGSESREHAAE